jgi:hypothetical protein
MSWWVHLVASSSHVAMGAMYVTWASIMSHGAPTHPSSPSFSLPNIDEHKLTPK